MRGLRNAPRAKWLTHDRDRPEAAAISAYCPRRAVVRARSARTCAEKLCMVASWTYAERCNASEHYARRARSSRRTVARARGATISGDMDTMTTQTHQLQVISANVRHLMRVRDWSVAALARRADVSKWSVSNALAGYPDSAPNLDTLQRLATAFGVPVWCLLLDLTGCPRGIEHELASLVQTYIRLGDAARHRLAVLAEVEAKLPR